MNLCVVDYRQGNVFLQIRRRSVEGFRLLVFVAKVPEVQPERLGREIFQALASASSDEARTWPSDELREQAKRIYAEAGTKGWPEYVRGTAEVTVTREGADVVVEPTSNLGSRGGFVPLPEEDWFRLSNPDDEELGRVVIEALIKSGAKIA